MQDEIAAVVQTFQQFSAANRERCESPRGFNHALQSWSTSDWFTAIMGELGEAANVAKKLNRVRDGIPGNKESEAALRDKLRRELADTFVYLDLLCQALGFNIGDAAIEVFNAKSAEIGYPLLLADRLSAASSSPGETRDVNAELLAALKDVVGDAAGEACDPLWIVRAEVISRGAIAIAKATASPHGPSSGEGQGGCR
jgi:NTP pyrophosphatase (non-canonical NTP hydrolase)